MPGYRQPLVIPGAELAFNDIATLTRLWHIEHFQFEPFRETALMDGNEDRIGPRQILHTDCSTS
jgi:hypothetical protein